MRAPSTFHTLWQLGEHMDLRLREAWVMAGRFYVGGPEQEIRRERDLKEPGRKRGVRGEDESGRGGGVEVSGEEGGGRHGSVDVANIASVCTTEL